MDGEQTPQVNSKSALAAARDVAPAAGPKVRLERLKPVADSPSERYELRDPFTELIYRAQTLPEMLAEALRLGASRFTAIDSLGRRNCA